MEGRCGKGSVEGWKWRWWEKWRGGRCTRVTVVGVHFGGTFCDFEVAFGGHLIEGGFAAGEEFAGVAMAGGIDVSLSSSLVSSRSSGEKRVRIGYIGGLPENVSLAVQLSGPFGLAAVAGSFIGRHIYFCFLFT